MRNAFFALLFTAAAAVALAPLPAFAQSADAPRTPWGKPDLQGVWDFATLTPMERPAEFTGKETLTRRGRGQYRRALGPVHAVALRAGGWREHG